MACVVIVAGLRANSISVLFGVVDVVILRCFLSTEIVLVLVVVAFFFGNKFAIMIGRCAGARGIRGGTL